MAKPVHFSVRAVVPQTPHEPAISGTAAVGETLTATTSGISDANGTGSASFSYQWLQTKDSTTWDIPVATSATYVVVDADQGADINRGWEVTIEPGGDGGVVIVLPRTTGDCTAASAVCMPDDRNLSTKTMCGPGT